ncbi:Hypothetical predicted protein [Pelobates cultripes]|uniref:Uncharacterized protein n=1 Tax=Pelobates cultripes TaxID=61616 RepID=A0AAD1WTW4_PELCU|nr:Hypothetical predicted protein [Pelobates cultripes]
MPNPDLEIAVQQSLQPLIATPRDSCTFSLLCRTGRRLQIMQGSDESLELDNTQNNFLWSVQGSSSQDSARSPWCGVDCVQHPNSHLQSLHVKSPLWIFNLIPCSGCPPSKVSGSAPGVFPIDRGLERSEKDSLSQEL